MSEKLVSIILLTWNGTRFIEPCLSAVFSQSYNPIELIVVDNGSTDDTPLQLRTILQSKNATNWKLDFLPLNTGFARGMNHGIAYASGDYILTLNQDLVMDSYFVEKLVEEMEKPGKKIKGSASGKILRWSPDTTSSRSNIIDSAGHVIFTDRIVEARGKSKQSEDFNEPCPVFGISASAGFYSVKALKDVSIDGEYFDNEFFSYLEDVDLDYRLTLGGYEARYVPDAVAWHAGGGSEGRKSFSIRFKAHMNRYLIWIKNERTGDLIHDFFPILLQEVFQFVRTLFTSPLLLLSWFTLPVKASRIIRSGKRINRTSQPDYFALRNFMQKNRLGAKFR
jgi:GT2 family glycosyltransferase